MLAGFIVGNSDMLFHSLRGKFISTKYKKETAGSNLDLLKI
jgi:hypothetical protein